VPVHNVAHEITGKITVIPFTQLFIIRNRQIDAEGLAGELGEANGGPSGEPTVDPDG